MDDQNSKPLLPRKVRFKGRSVKRHPFTDDDATKTREQREMEALEQADDAPPPLEAEGMREGCMGCLWVTLFFFALLAGGILINCTRHR